MSLSLLTRQPVTWDSDAAAYITAVESADAQSLEAPIARAINRFVIDCKISGIWDAIKSCCLLCGARTQAGAVVPLKGVAPTLTSFVGNYNRETGLRRTSGSFNTNRNNNADPQDNKHIACYLSSLDTTSATATVIAANSQSTCIYTDSSRRLRMLINGASAVNIDTFDFNSLCGMSILNNSEIQYIYGNKINIKNVTLNSPINYPTSLYAGGGLTPSTHRISFYSIGERLDLRLLKQVVDRFNETLFRYFYPSSLHPEASSWISSAEAFGQPKVSATVASALNTFCNSIDSANLRSKFYRLNLFCGPSLTTAIIPLYRGPSSGGTQYGNTTDQSSGFSNTAHYSELGLQGTIASSTYLETGLLTTTINTLYPSVHFSVYANNTPTLGEFIRIGDGATNYQLVGEFGGSFLNLVGGTFQTAPMYGTPSGMTIISRTATNLARLYRNGNYVTQTTATISSPPTAAGTAWSTQSLRLFAQIIQNNAAAAYSNLRSCGYSIGSGLTQQEATDYYNIMQTFQVSLGRQL